MDQTPGSQRVATSAKGENRGVTLTTSESDPTNQPEQLISTCLVLGTRYLELVGTTLGTSHTSASTKYYIPHENRSIGDNQ